MLLFSEEGKEKSGSRSPMFQVDGVTVAMVREAFAITDEEKSRLCPLTESAPTKASLSEYSSVDAVAETLDGP